MDRHAREEREVLFRGMTGTRIGRREREGDAVDVVLGVVAGGVEVCGGVVVVVVVVVVVFVDCVGVVGVVVFVFVLVDILPLPLPALSTLPTPPAAELAPEAEPELGVAAEVETGTLPINVANLNPPIANPAPIPVRSDSRAHGFW